jgi:hypothetical protein
MTETINRSHSILKVSPFVGYTFQETASGYNNKMGIFTPTFDDPLQNLSLSKMRNNLYCLENPQTFEDVKKGRYKYQKDNTFILKNPDSKQFHKRLSGFKLEDLPLAVQKSLNEPERYHKPTRSETPKYVDESLEMRPPAAQKFVAVHENFYTAPDGYNPALSENQEVSYGEMVERRRLPKLGGPSSIHSRSQNLLPKNLKPSMEINQSTANLKKSVRVPRK